MRRPLCWLMVTLLLVAMSELQTMGMLPDMARSLGTSTAMIGTLISVYAFGMAIGGPLLAWALRLVPPKAALLRVVAVYHLSLAAALVVLALFSDVPPAALSGVLLVGLVGVSMNPALVARVVQVAGAGGLVNTVHTSVITLGVVAGSAVGGLAISAGGDRSASAAMWTGAVLAFLAIVVLGAQTLGRKDTPAAEPQAEPQVQPAGK
ncbi:MFS transporter [Streptomyces albidoflavus]|uniref:MFS transporter n=1 Tax=Streptomyces albidoflavus TaxID=1886 RepID=UPI0033F8C531